MPVVDQQASPQERESLLVVSQLLAAVAFRNPNLLAIFGGERPMIESPLLDDRKVLFRQMGVQDAVLAALDERFGSVPEEIASSVRAIRENNRLSALHRYAISCPDLESFRSRLAVPKAD